MPGGGFCVAKGDVQGSSKRPISYVGDAAVIEKSCR